MTCEEAQAFLEAVGGDVPRDAACAAHLRSCPVCASYAAHLPAEDELLTRVLSTPPEEESFQRVRANLAYRIAPERSARSGRRRVPPVQAPRFGWALPVAAMIGVTVIGGLIYFTSQIQDHPTEPVETAQANPKDKDQDHATKLPALPPVVEPEHKVAGNTATKTATTSSGHNEVVKAPAPPPVRPADQQHTPPVKAAPTETASASQPQSGPRLAQLRSRIRDQMVLDDVEQLAIVFDNSGYPDATAVMEDAELYLERILAAENNAPEESRQTLAGSRGVTEHLHRLQESVTEDAPAPLKNALQRTLAALDEAASIAPDAGLKAGDSAGTAMAQAETEYNHGAYADALNSFRNMADHFAGDHRAVAARYTMAFILQKKMSKDDEARSIYQSIADAHHGLSSHASYHIGESYERGGDAAKALAVYKNLLKSPQGHARAASLREKVAFLEAQLKGTQLAHPGWAKDVPKTLHLTSPIPSKPKGEHGK